MTNGCLEGSENGNKGAGGESSLEEQDGADEVVKQNGDVNSHKDSEEEEVEEGDSEANGNKQSKELEEGDGEGDKKRWRKGTVKLMAINNLRSLRREMARRIRREVRKTEAKMATRMNYQRLLLHQSLQKRKRNQ